MQIFNEMFTKSYKTNKYSCWIKQTLRPFFSKQGQIDVNILFLNINDKI